MATNFSPCKGSYVLNQFQSNVMFSMNGFYVSASSTGETQESMNNVSCRRDMTEILLKAA